MPIVYDFPDDIIPEADSLGHLEKILDKYPKYIPECELELASFIDFSASSKVKGVKCYEFKKIRIYLNAIMVNEGYPARRHHTVQFFDLLMFSCPFYTKLAVKRTMDYWDEDGHDLPVKSTGFGGKVTKTSKISRFKWRKVIMYKIPDEIISQFLGLLPDMIPIHEIMTLGSMITNSFEWPLFNNLVQYGGLHNFIIVCNWDYVLAKLNEGGY